MNAYGRIIALGILTLSLVSCGGGGGGSNTTSAPPPTTSTLTSTASASLPSSTLAPNQLAVTVEQDTSLSAYQTVNLPYVSVKICASATNCTTVNHVVVDTGSYGLRVLQSALPAGFSSSLTPEMANGSSYVAECVSFLDGFMWGRVVTATVQLNGETASSLPVQIVGDTAVPGISSSSIPSTCTGTGTGLPDESNLAGIGGNGILGVGLFTNDNQLYYTCPNGSCALYSPTQQVSNPVPDFPVDNNGVILQMPAVPNGGAVTATGVLTFGVGTETDNSTSGLQWLAADSYGNITVTLQSTTYNSSFIDSGSNFYYVPLINNVPTDSNGNYTPASLTTYPLLLTPNTGTGSAISQSMLVVNPAQIPSASLAIDDVDIDVPSNTSADIGMPFFYGKSLAFLINGASINSGALTGPQYGLSTAP
jgi:hypothetical protein